MFPRRGSASSRAGGTASASRPVTGAGTKRTSTPSAAATAPAASRSTKGSSSSSSATTGTPTGRATSPSGTAARDPNTVFAELGSAPQSAGPNASQAVDVEADTPAPKQTSSIAPGAEVKDEIDLALPMEVDLDGDPTQEDAVRLVSVALGVDRVVSENDPDATRHPTAPLVTYRFPKLQPGTYSIQVRVDGRWVPYLTGVTLRLDGLYLGEKRLQGWVDPASLGTPAPDDVVDDTPEEKPEYFDFNAAAEL